MRISSKPLLHKPMLSFLMAIAACMMIGCKKHEPVPPCADCGGEIKAAMGKSAEFMAAYTTRHYGVPLCAECAQIRKNSAENAAAEPSDEAQKNETEGSEDEIEQQ